MGFNIPWRKVGVVWGGPSREREVSYRSAQNVATALQERGYEVYLLELSSNLPFQLKEKKVEVVFLATHGKWGEDGKVQGLLEVMGIPYTGSGVLASALAMNKLFSKKIWEREEIPTPPYQEISSKNWREDVGKGIEKLGIPLVIKPVSEGSSIGVKIVDEKEVWNAVKGSLEEFGEVFLEAYIEGKEVTVGILGEGETLRALPILELVPKEKFYNYSAKYTPGLTQFIIPARLEKEVYSLTQEIAVKAHKALGCSGFSRVDILVSNGIPYVHDLNTIPGLTSLSDLPKEAEACGISFPDLIEEILSYASYGKR
ncbi:D-alanine--D-alanine ligase [Candidatus Calescamantes bacterium]|nr:D-alanine--D-alanine ligase [Candidatus Calescamantes bacterium]